MADRPIPVEPIGYARGYSPMLPGPAWYPVYTPSPEARAFAERCSAARLGDYEVSGLEHGRYTVPDFEALWREVSRG